MHTSILTRRSFNSLCLCAVALFVCKNLAHSAVLLDWDALTWTAGDLSNSYDLNGDGTTDVTVAITTSGNITWQNGAQVGVTGNAPFTDVGTGNSGPGTGGTTGKLLSLWMNVNGNANSFVRLTVTFSGIFAGGVQDVSLALHDIDQGSYQDQIRTIRAINSVGTTVYATSVTNSGSISDSVTGSGANYRVTGNNGAADNNTAQGDATISFANQTITQFSFVYGNPTTLSGINSAQHIQIGDLFYTPTVPEAGSGIFSAAICLVTMAFARLSRKSVTSEG